MQENVFKPLSIHFTVILDSDSEGNSALRSAWNELSAIEKEVKRYREIRVTTENDLEECRKRGVALEDVSMYLWH